jgi:RNA polymerase sigma-70 factor, ECF subfamily
VIPFKHPEPVPDDEVKFIQLIADHQNLIRNFIISLLPGAPGVDDVFQNTNAVIWRKRESFEMGSNFRAWALSIARFQAMAHLQQLRRRRWVSLDSDVAELIADDLEDRPDKRDAELKLAALEDCLSKLRPKDRELLVQRYWHRTRLQDFAVVSGRSVSTLKVTLFRLRAGLKRCVESRITASPDLP